MPEAGKVATNEWSPCTTMEKISGKRLSPWRPPPGMSKKGERLPLTMQHAWVLVRPNETHLMKEGGKFMDVMMVYMKSWLTLSNAFSKSRKRRNPFTTRAPGDATPMTTDNEEIDPEIDTEGSIRYRRRRHR